MNIVLLNGRDGRPLKNTVVSSLLIILEKHILVTRLNIIRIRKYVDIVQTTTKILDVVLGGIARTKTIIF